MAAYSQDLRDRVLSALARGEGATALAQRLDVSVRWVYHVKDRYEQSGERGARRLGATGARGWPPAKRAFGAGWLSRWT